MIPTPDIEQVIGADAVDPHDDRIGRVSQVYVDADTDRPTWVSVRTGLFGLSESLVPLDDATWDQEQLHVRVEKAQVKDAPRVDPEAEISPDEQDRLYRYYGLAGSTGAGAERSGLTDADGAESDRPGIGMAGMQDMSGSDADLRTVAVPPDRAAEAEAVDAGTSRHDLGDGDVPAEAGGADPFQGDPAMQTESGALGTPAGPQQVGAGMQPQPGGGMRLRRYLPGAASSRDDAGVGTRTYDQDPTDPGRR